MANEEHEVEAFLAAMGPLFCPHRTRAEANETEDDTDESEKIDEDDEPL